MESIGEIKMMPRGKKIKSGYATVDEGGMDYRSISKEMEKHGYSINHSSVRNDLLKGMKKIASNLSHRYDLKLTDDELFKLAKDPNFQDCISEIILEISRGEE
jgi:hypothetical protein